MTDAKAEILAAIRSAAGRDVPLPLEQTNTLEQRFASPPVHVRPASPADPEETFVAKLEAVAGTAARVSGVADVPQAVLTYLERHSLPAGLVATDDPILSESPWPADLTLSRRQATRDDQLSITGAFAAVAETGSVVLLSGPGTPTALNFLPDHHIVVLRKSQILSHIEDVWTLLRRRSPTLPRTINFITGPSRTADVEQTIQIGAHGPRRLHVVLVRGC